MAVKGDNYDQKIAGDASPTGGQETSVANPVSVTGNTAQDAAGAGPKTSSVKSAGSQNVANPTATSSGQFTNLKSYLDANSGYNQGSGGLAGQINSNLQNQSNQIGSGIQSAQNDFNTQAQKSTYQYDPTLVNNTLANPYQYTNPTVKDGTQYQGYTYTNGNWVNTPPPASPGNALTLKSSGQPGDTSQPAVDDGSLAQQIQTFVSSKGAAPTNSSPENGMNQDPSLLKLQAAIAAGPTPLTPDQQATINAGYAQQGLQDFNNMRDANYQGPTALDQDSQLQNKVANFQQLANSAQSENGRFALLRNMFDAPSYTGGQQTLDNLFLQANPNQIAQLQQSGTIANNLNNQLGGALTGARQQALQDANTDVATAGKTLDATNNAIGNFDNQQATNVMTAEAQRDRNFQNQQNQLKAGSMSYNDAKALGLVNNDRVGANTYNLDLNRYLTEGNATATKQNVMSQDDYNKINALGKLANGKQSGSSGSVLDNYKDASQVGQFAAQPGYAFNANAFRRDAGDAQHVADVNLSPKQQQIQATEAQMAKIQSEYADADKQIKGWQDQENQMAAQQGAPLGSGANASGDPRMVAHGGGMETPTQQLTNPAPNIPSSFNPFSSGAQSGVPTPTIDSLKQMIAHTQDYQKGLNDQTSQQQAQKALQERQLAALQKFYGVNNQLKII